MRPSGRRRDQMREVRLTPHFTRHAEGSVLAEFGDTRVLCTASVESKVPPFLKGKAQGWVTAEYGMLPRATHSRTQREAARGTQSGRTLEIQRLIGRSLRAVVDRAALGENTITIDCDVLQADGGTRTAAITGGYVALALAAAQLVKAGKIAAQSRARAGRRRFGRHLPRATGARSRLRRGLRGRDGHERRDERRARASSRCRAPPKATRCSAASSTCCSTSPPSASSNCSPRRPPSSGSDAAAALGARDRESRQGRGAFGAARRSGPRATRDGPIRARRRRSARNRRHVRRERAAEGAARRAHHGAVRDRRRLGPRRRRARRRSRRALGALRGRAGRRRREHREAARGARRPSLDRSARFHCVLVALRHPDDAAPLIATGSWAGQIARAPRGSRGFGYDPVFFDPELGRTAAELDAAEKNRVSHRGAALRALIELLKNR